MIGFQVRDFAANTRIGINNLCRAYRRSTHKHTHKTHTLLFTDTNTNILLLQDCPVLRRRLSATVESSRIVIEMYALCAAMWQMSSTARRTECKNPLSQGPATTATDKIRSNAFQCHTSSAVDADSCGARVFLSLCIFHTRMHSRNFPYSKDGSSGVRA